MTRVLIADDHGLLRAGLRALLQMAGEMEVVGEAADGYEALAQAGQLQPDVVLADISMPGPSGIEIAASLRTTAPKIRVLIMTMHEDQQLVQEALTAGAAGYLIKRAAETDLIHAIQTVMDGKQYVHEDVAPPPRPESAGEVGRPAVPAHMLTADERRLLRELVLSHPIQQIAADLNMPLSQVEQLRERVMDRLGIRTRIGLISYARRNNIV